MILGIMDKQVSDRVENSEHYRYFELLHFHFAAGRFVKTDYMVHLNNQGSAKC